MTFYSDYPARRARQIATDLIALALIAASVALGAFVYRLVQGLSGFGQQMESSGSQFSATMTQIGTNLGSVPLIGGGIRKPFDGASDAGSSLQAAGHAQQLAVHQLATGLGIGIAVVPVVAILLLWLMPRIRFARRASSAKRLVASASLDLLALRALARCSIRSISAVSTDAAGAWRNGDAAVIRSLAEIELASAGVRLPAVSAG